MPEEDEISPSRGELATVSSIFLGQDAISLLPITALAHFSAGCRRLREKATTKRRKKRATCFYKG
jgi:hypothetical protein